MKHSFKLIMALGAAALSAGSAEAILIEDAPGVIDLTPHAEQPANSGNAVIPWVESAATHYNAEFSADLPLDIVAVFKNNQYDDNGPAGYPVFGDGVRSIDIPLGDFDYLALHWGGPAQGQTPNYQLFYIGDSSETVATVVNGDRQGLSWYQMFHGNGASVPDSGASLALLGLALFGLAALRRRLR